jgi:NADPH:quinone reductase
MAGADRRFNPVPIASSNRPSEEADIHAGIFAGLENGTLRPIVGKELPLAESARAHKEILKPGSAGKIVLIC